MPYQVVTDPKTGKATTVVTGFGGAKEEATAPDSNSAVSTVVSAVGSALRRDPVLGPSGDSAAAAVAGAQSGIQTLLKTGDLGKAAAAYQQGFMRDINTKAGPLGRIIVKGGRDLTQSVLGNLPADELARTGFTKPRMPGAPDAPILGILPALPKVQTKSPVEDVLAGFLQGGMGLFLATRGLKAGGALAAKAPGAGAVTQAVQPLTQGVRTVTAFAKGAPGGLGQAARVAAKGAEIVVKGATAGAVVDYAGFDPGEERLSDQAIKWVEKQAGTPLGGPLLDLVRSAPGDTAADARWKNAVEGFLFLGPALGVTIESLGRTAKAVINRNKAWQATRSPEPTPEPPAAGQTVDVSATPVTANGVDPRSAPGITPPAQKTKATAPDVAKAYMDMRPRTPLWEQKGVEIQGFLDDPWTNKAAADADLGRAIADTEAAVAKASSTVPDDMGAVPTAERGNVMPSYSQVRETPVTEISTDPVRLQFKAAGIGKTGTTGSLKAAASYDPLFGKIISVWRDPQTNQLLVVNGHNRLDLARRSGVQNVLTWEIDAPTAEQARAIGAMENIAEGQGTAWDAAKIMRDMGIDAEEMVSRNIDVTKGVAEKGVALSRLPQDVFEQGVTGKLALDKAVALGSEQLDDAVVRDVATEAIKGKWSAEKITQAMQEAKFAQTTGPAGGVLPGMEELFKTSNFSQLLDVRTEAFKALREEMVALTSVAREGRRGILEAAGNVVNVAGSQAAREQAGTAVNVFNQVAGYTGPVRDLLNEIAGQVGGKRTAKAVVAANLDRLRAAIEDELKGPRLPLGQAAAAAPSVPSAGIPAPVPAAPAPTTPAPAKAELPDTRGQGQFFHGAAAEIKQLDEGYYETMNIYGQGFYTTDDVKTAGSYTKKNVRSVANRGGTPDQVIYQAVEREPVKFYDLDAPASDSVKQQLEQASKYSESVGRALDEFDGDPSLAELMDEIRANSRSAGESADTIQEVFEGLRETLEGEGYGGFTHVGGKLTKSGREHQVRIYWNPETQLELAPYGAPPAAQAAPAPAAQAAPAPAAAVEPPAALINIPAAASRKITAKTDEFRIETAAGSLAGWTRVPGTAGMPMEQAFEVVRAKGAILDPDAIPGLNMDAARNDNAMGRTTPETEAVAAAYKQFYQVGDEPPRIGLTSETVDPMDPGFVRQVGELLPQQLPDSYRVDPDVVAAVKDSMVKAVRRIAGDDITVRFNDNMVFRKGTAAHGTQGKVRRIGGSYELDVKSSIEGDPIKEVINFHEMGLMPFKGANVVDYAKDRLSAAAHESFHALQLRSMTSAQLKVMNTMFAKLKLYFAEKNRQGRDSGRRDKPLELGAQAFESYDEAAREGVSPALVLLGLTPDDIRIFRSPPAGGAAVKLVGGTAKAILDGITLVDNMFDYAEKLYNVFRLRGWTSVRDIFAQAYAGEMKKQTDKLGNVLDVVGVAEGQEKEWARRIRELDKQGTPAMKSLVDFAQGEGLLSEGPARLTSEVPEGPRPVDPAPGPESSDDWVRRFARQLEANRQGLLDGSLTMEDLMANSFQKVQSPSGSQQYTAVRENLVDGMNAMSKVLPDRAAQTGMPSFKREELRAMNQAWFDRHGEDGAAINRGLEAVTRGFDEYELGALNRAMALADKKQVEASMEAAMWLNSANVDGVNQSERLARLITAAESSRATHEAVMRVTRPWGQLGVEMQVPRNYEIPPATGAKEAPVPATPDAPATPEPLVDVTGAPQVVDVEGQILEELEAQSARPIEETITGKIDEDLAAAANGGEITPKAQAAADALAQALVSAGAEPAMRNNFWRRFDETKKLEPNALLMLRTNNLISSGVTANTNLTNGLLNLARLPLSQAGGALAQGELKRAMYSMMMFQQYWTNMSSAMRLAGHAFKAGRSLMNLDVSSMDYMDRIAQREAQGELLSGPDARTGWTINTVDMSQQFAQTTQGQLVNRLWQVLGTGASRLALGIDTFNSTLAGYAYEHVRHLPRGMELATERGMKEFSSEAWKFAQQYADARTQETMKDAVINDKNLADVAMESPQAKNFMNAINFTDNVWAELEPRTLAGGVSIGQSRGLAGNELQDFARQYVEEGQMQHRLANFALNGPVSFGRLGSLPGEAMSTLSNARLIGPVFKFIQPFQRVPSNIIKSAMRNTPAALFVDTWWRDIVSEDAFTRDRAIGEIVVGSSAMALVSMASAMGSLRLNGGGPIDPAARDKWTNIEKRMPYSIQFWDEAAGKWTTPTSMRALEPYATLFGAIGDYVDIANSLSTESRNRLGSALVLTLARMSTSGLLSKSYFQGVNELYEAAFNPSKIMVGPAQRDPLSRYLSRIVASMVPHSSALRAARRETDQVTRSVDPSDIGGFMGFFQETLDEVRNAVPGWSNSLPARRDWINGSPILTQGILGAEIVPAEMPWLQAAMQFTPFAAFQQGRQLLGPVHQEMGMLSGKGTNFMGPRAADFGTEMRLTPSELEEYTIRFASIKDEYGFTFEQSVTQLIQSPQYQSWPVDGPSSRDVSLRAAAIQTEIQRYKKLAKEDFKIGTPKGQLIAAEEAAAEARKAERTYIQQYGMDNSPQPAQAGASWSPTPGNR